MEQEETKRIKLLGKDDKWQLTALFAGSMSGDFLPVQLGKKPPSVYPGSSFQQTGTSPIPAITGAMKLQCISTSARSFYHTSITSVKSSSFLITILQCSFSTISKDNVHYSS